MARLNINMKQVQTPVYFLGMYVELNQINFLNYNSEVKTRMTNANSLS